MEADVERVASKYSSPTGSPRTGTPRGSYHLWSSGDSIDHQDQAGSILDETNKIDMKEMVPDQTQSEGPGLFQSLLGGLGVQIGDGSYPGAHRKG